MQLKFKLCQTMYYERIIDTYLSEWASRNEHKPVLLRGARQVGKSTAVRHLGESFKTYVEINFEKQPEYKILFQDNLDVTRIVSQISAISGKAIKAGETLLFLDEIQMCREAIMSLRFFKEDMPDLHVIAAGSLLEFALEELPTLCSCGKKARMNLRLIDGKVDKSNDSRLRLREEEDISYISMCRECYYKIMNDIKDIKDIKYYDNTSKIKK